MTNEIPVADLVERLQRLEDAETARNHLHAYAASLDDPIPDEVAALFLPDGALKVPGAEFTGREEIAAFYRDRSGPEAGEKRHFLTNVRTRHLGDGRVEVASYFLFTARKPVASVLGWGTYVDTIQVTDGVAHFEEKVITPHFAADIADGWAKPLG